MRSYATVCEEDNDGGGPMYLVRKVFPTASPEVVPDVVILTDGTGCSKNGALGIYRGQRGRMQIEVTVTGKSCHGSMPWEGNNPLEFGGAILKEAAGRTNSATGFKDHPFLGHGTRTASWAGWILPAIAPFRSNSRSASTAASPSARPQARPCAMSNVWTPSR